jgi:hypothetical protein
MEVLAVVLAAVAGGVGYMVTTFWMNLLIR